jgi:hypothetical protein
MRARNWKGRERKKMKMTGVCKLSRQSITIPPKRALVLLYK